MYKSDFYFQVKRKCIYNRNSHVHLNLIFLCFDRLNVEKIRDSIPKNFLSSFPYTSYLPFIWPRNHIFFPLSLLHTSISCYTLFHGFFFPTQQKPCSNPSIRPVSEVLWNVTLTLGYTVRGGSQPLFVALVRLVQFCPT